MMNSDNEKEGVHVMHKYNRILLKDMKVYSGEKTFDRGYIKIINGRIIEVAAVDQLVNEEDFHIISVPGEYCAIPGMIDIHIHGSGGADTMDGTIEALNTLSSSLPAEGTTSFLATTITQSKELLDKALLNLGNYIPLHQQEGHAEILGVHLEGPFINHEMAGAQPEEHIIEPDIELFNHWQHLAKGTIRLITLAPEVAGGLELIHYLKENGVIISIGHSNATYDEMDAAISTGANQVTHLFNQMRGLHHREPGVVGAAFIRDELFVELIVDGIHVSPKMVKLTYQQVTDKRLIVITDAMRAKGLSEGSYDLGGQAVTVKNGKAILSDGSLAGSVLNMGTAFRNILAFTGCTIENAVKMTSENPAKEIGVFDQKGSITVGKDADIVLLDENLEVVMTFCKGIIAFQKGEKNE